MKKKAIVAGADLWTERWGIKSEKWMMRDGQGVGRCARDILVQVNRDLLSSNYVS